MNQIVKSLREQSAQAGTAKQWKLEELCKMAALEIETKAATIARLTAANESMQEDAVQNTYAFNLMLTANKEQAEEIRAIKEAIEDIKYYVGNPSAWEYYDDGVSEKIRAILKAAGMA